MAKTFRKSDGAAINIFVDDDDLTDRMQGILWKYLVASDEAGDAEDFVKEIGDFLEANYGNRERLHLDSTIFLAPDGVHLQYAPLEISFWAMGDQEIVIPYQAAKPFLTPEAARLAGVAK